MTNFVTESGERKTESGDRIANSDWWIMISGERLLKKRTPFGIRIKKFQLPN